MYGGGALGTMYSMAVLQGLMTSEQALAASAVAAGVPKGKGSKGTGKAKAEQGKGGGQKGKGKGQGKKGGGRKKE